MRVSTVTTTTIAVEDRTLMRGQLVRVAHQALGALLTMGARKPPPFFPCDGVEEPTLRRRARPTRRLRRGRREGRGP
jgi:hypothetical protein